MEIKSRQDEEAQLQDVFETLLRWYPARLAEESGMRPERVKILRRLQKGYCKFPAGSEGSTGRRSVLREFQDFLYPQEWQSVKKLVPRQICGDKFKFIDLFAGIGGLRLPFSRIGGRCVLTCEWDEYARRTYEANWKSCPEHRFVSDIRDITRPGGMEGQAWLEHCRHLVPDHDLLLAGFPCQPFSIAGVSKKNAMNRAHGFDCQDQGQLFFDICRILLVKQPAVAVLENVKNLKSHNDGTTFRVIRDILTRLPEHQTTLFGTQVVAGASSYWIANLGDEQPDPKIIDGSHFVPQHRERIVLLCIRQDIVDHLDLAGKIDLRNIRTPGERLTLNDILDPNSKVSDKYTLSPKLWNYLEQYAARHRARGNGFGYGMVRRNRKDIARTLSARYYKDGSEILVNQDSMKNNPSRLGRPRRLTPQECSRLMGFVKKGEQFNIPVSDTRSYKQFGNSVVVPVFQAVADLLRPFLSGILEFERKRRS